MRLNQLSLNQKLAAVALLLGAGALAGEPRGGDTVELDTRELAGIVQREADHVTASEVSDWILQNRTDYRLVDLRDAAAYETYHIPTAERLALTDLPDAPLGRAEKIVLYSDGGIHAAQAWMLLKAKDYKGVTVLQGGLDAWKDEVLFPALPPDANAAQKADFERIAYVSRFFGGEPRSGSVAREAPTVELPKPKPVTPAAAPASAPAKKRREGC